MALGFEEEFSFIVIRIKALSVSSMFEISYQEAEIRGWRGFGKFKSLEI